MIFATNQLSNLSSQLERVMPPNEVGIAKNNIELGKVAQYPKIELFAFY